MVIDTIEQLKEKIEQYEYIHIYLHGIKQSEDSASEEPISINSKILSRILDVFITPSKNSDQSQKTAYNNTKEKADQILEEAMKSIIGSVPSIEKLINEAQKNQNNK